MADYEGFYARFDTASKSEGSLLMGPDTLVGDDLEVFFKTDDGRVVAWLRNKFGQQVGFLDVDGSRRLQLAQARDLEIRAILSFVAYSDLPDPGLYWGQVALFCFNPAYADEINAFIDRIASKIAEGTRPDINLRTQAVQKIFDDPTWVPTNTIPLPKKEQGTAILKDHQSLSERMIEQGRARNKGCYAISIAFLIILAALIVFGALKLLNIL